MAFSSATRKYCIPRGMAFFGICDPVSGLPDKGELYLGLTGEITFAQEVTKQEILSSECGLLTKVADIPVRVDRSIALPVLECSNEVRELFFGGTLTALSQAAAVATAYTIDDVQLGRYYQLGKDSTFLNGARNISNVTMVGFVEGDDFRVDEANGTIYFFSVEEQATTGGTITQGTNVAGTYDQAATTIEEIQPNNTVGTEGTLRIQPCDALGNGDEGGMLFFQVELAPGGDYILKTDNNTPRVMAFDVAVNQPATGPAWVYTDP